MTSPNAFSTRLLAVTTRPALLPGILLVLGSLLFIGGGSQHPMINDSLGPLGSEQFYQAFVAHVRMSAHWEAFHNLILIGPVLWALGGPGAEAILPRSGAQLWAVARMAIGIGATAWIVAFALDGHNAPAFAQAIATATDPGTVRDKLFEFAMSSRLVAYFGRIGWTMMSLAFAAYGAGLMLTARGTVWSKAVGATGVLLGLWTIFEVARGDFTPGPFTSHFWMPTALVTGLWVAAFGVTIARSRSLPTTSG